MKCVFCAEEIQPKAVFCRFCGAVKEEGVWKHPAGSGQSPAKVPSTIRVAGILFFASAVLELLFLNAEVPLFGAVRGGPVAVAYHLLYVTLFAALGVGLLARSRWGYLLVFAGTLFYTLDKVLYVLDRETMETYLTHELKGTLELLDLVERDSVFDIAVTTTLLFVACWWVFALYVYLRRSCFRQRRARTSSS